MNNLKMVKTGNGFKTYSCSILVPRNLEIKKVVNQ